MPVTAPITANVKEITPVILPLANLGTPTSGATGNSKRGRAGDTLKRQRGSRM